MTVMDSKVRNGIGGSALHMIVQYIVPLLSVMFAVGMAYASLRSSVCANAKQIDVNCNYVRILDTSVRTNREDIIKMQTDIQYIKRGVDEINDALKDRPNRGTP